MKEHEHLPFLIEELKNTNNDIENCLEDLTCYPFHNDREFLQGLKKKNQFIKRMAFEYQKYKRNLRNYREFRDTVLHALLQYDFLLPYAKLQPFNTL